MIFTTDRDGRATYVSPGWEDLTGQPLDEAVNFGWTNVLHPEDREVARATVRGATREKCEFSVRYRLLCRDGRCLWMAAGAIPSFGPPNRTFLGFMGSIAQIAEESTTGLKADGSLGRSMPPQGASPNSVLELAADHLIVLHGVLARSGYDHIHSAIARTLHQVGIELARIEKREADLTKYH